MACISVSTFGFSMTGFAQSPEDLKKQVPTTEKGIKAAVKNAPNAVAAPLPAGSPKLDALRARAKMLIEKKAADVEAIESGKLSLFSKWHEARPANLKLLADLDDQLKAINAEANPTKKEERLALVFAAIQPIGFLLEDADYLTDYQNILKPDEVTEIRRLEEQWDTLPRNHPEEAAPLQLLDAGMIYTLMNLRVPLAVKAPPRAMVVFRANDGGVFSNNLNIIETEADKNGLATTTWTSHGDSIADGVINVRSADAPSLDSYRIRVVKLQLRPIPGTPAALVPGQQEMPEEPSK